MNEALCSIITSEEDWHFHSEGRSIRFNADGTGELQCRCNLNFWIMAELKWKIAKPKDVEALSSPSKGAVPSNDANSPEVLGTLRLEITLTKDLAGRNRTWAEKHPENVKYLNQSLKEEAYRTKSFSIRIEQGNFVEPSFIGCKHSDAPRYSRRLLFDKSPYPPRSEWLKPEAGPDDGQFWDHVEFVGRPAPESAKRKSPMNDPSASTWSLCIVQ